MSPPKNQAPPRAESVCGLWPSPKGLVAVVVDEEGRPEPPLLILRDDDGCWEGLSQLDAAVGLGYELVLPSWLARSCPIARLALERGIQVWLVPKPLVEAIRFIAALTKAPPRKTAAALARIPLTMAMRGALQPLAPDQALQLPLF